MSSPSPLSTRERILDAAQKLVRRGEGIVSMAAIAKAAGLSRQALYLTFADRADLYVALVRRVDEARGIPEEFAKVRNAPDAVAAIRALVDMQARLLPLVKPIADVFELLRRQDPDAERAWQDRLDSRRDQCRYIVERLVEEKRLRPDLSPGIAADLAWSLTSFRMWDELVVQCGWTAERYGTYVSALIENAIVAPRSRPAPSRQRRPKPGAKP
ncbi:TetR/AcrR family transcriptional regulator [Sphingosinicella microcystinivorans]|uniref:TetR/AcrR family transcriptional regulator n=1 Tax=Sphingosinicella microcystinivorans TaxID=335406 RepID=UPI0022F3CDAA|nr:TetR/AcrR family transcriptional regulator [Sphingosinicella microcystinivorans]WBX84878.1 TetR/AcrR family transcriptional regulator [Sphingosinicella microcystinivorans]